MSLWKKECVIVKVELNCIQAGYGKDLKKKTTDETELKINLYIYITTNRFSDSDQQHERTCRLSLTGVGPQANHM